jgi:hypothetical protein
MSATTSGAIKAYLEGQGLGIAVYRDLAPQGARLPFATVQEAISTTLDSSGDVGDPDRQVTVREDAQVTVWQPFRAPDGTSGESPTLVRDVIHALHGARLVTSPTTVYGCLVTFRTRRPRVDAPGTGEADDGANLIQDVLTLTLRRNL